MTAEVWTEMCETCVFRPGNRMHLRPGALADLVRGNLQAGSLLHCHETTYGQREQGEVYCRGFVDRYGDRTNLGRIIPRLGGYTEVES